MPVGSEWLRGSTKLILHAAVGGVGSVLDLDPVRRSTGAIWAIAVLGNQALQSHQASVTKQVRTDLPCSKSLRKMPPTRRARRRERLALRIDSGSLRTSSPSLTRISKA